MVLSTILATACTIIVRHVRSYLAIIHGYIHDVNRQFGALCCEVGSYVYTLQRRI